MTESCAGEGGVMDNESAAQKAAEGASEIEGTGSRHLKNLMAKVADKGERLKLEPGRKGAKQNKQRRKKELNEI